MTVFVAYLLEFDSEFVTGVFSTLEKAQEHLMSKINDPDNDHYGGNDVLIESYELDNPDARKRFYNYVDGEWDKMYND